MAFSSNKRKREKAVEAGEAVYGPEPPPLSSPLYYSSVEDFLSRAPSKARKAYESEYRGIDDINLYIRLKREYSFEFTSSRKTRTGKEFEDLFFETYKDGNLRPFLGYRLYKPTDQVSKNGKTYPPVVDFIASDGEDWLPMEIKDNHLYPYDKEELQYIAIRNRYQFRALHKDSLRNLVVPGLDIKKKDRLPGLIIRCDFIRSQKKVPEPQKYLYGCSVYEVA